MGSETSVRRSVGRVRGETPLFFPASGGSTPRRQRRGDIHSSIPLSSPSLARRAAAPSNRPDSLFRASSPSGLTEPATPAPIGTPEDVGGGHFPSGPTLSAIDGEGGVIGTEGDGGMVKYIWGTTISLHEAMNDFRSFLRGFKVKYRAAYNTTISKQAVEAGGLAPPPMPLYDGLLPAQGEQVLYERYLRHLRETGQTNLNLDALNLLAYPPTKKLYHQLVSYPQEVIPIMDQVLRDVMIESAEEELEAVQAKLADGQVGELDVRVVEEEVREVEGRVFKVRPFGGEKTINMRDLNPGGKYRVFGRR